MKLQKNIENLTLAINHSEDMNRIAEQNDFLDKIILSVSKCFVFLMKLNRSILQIIN